MNTITIGRDAGNQVVLVDNLVSRYHAQLLILDNGSILIKDLGSTNGTFVNGNRITEHYLNNGDIVKCSAAQLNWPEIINKYSFKPKTPVQQPTPQQPVTKPLAQEPPIQQSYIVPVVGNSQSSMPEEKKMASPPKAEPLENNNDDKLKCPKCSSSNIHIDKKGFGGAKACCGGLACGPLGMLFGTAGANKLRKTCLKCNNSWY